MGFTGVIATWCVVFLKKRHGGPSDKWVDGGGGGVKARLNAGIKTRLKVSTPSRATYYLSLWLLSDSDVDRANHVGLVDHGASFRTNTRGTIFIGQVDSVCVSIQFEAFFVDYAVLQSGQLLLLWIVTIDTTTNDHKKLGAFSFACVFSHTLLGRIADRCGCLFIFSCSYARDLSRFGGVLTPLVQNECVEPLPILASLLHKIVRVTRVERGLWTSAATASLLVYIAQTSSAFFQYIFMENADRLRESRSRHSLTNCRLLENWLRVFNYGESHI